MTRPAANSHFCMWMIGKGFKLEFKDVPQPVIDLTAADKIMQSQGRGTITVRDSGGSFQCRATFNAEASLEDRITSWCGTVESAHAWRQNYIRGLTAR